MATEQSHHAAGAPAHRRSDGRDETEAERLDRNWGEILQELRVTQTGSQILTGFLLTIPFQSRFSELETHERVIYLVLVGFAVLATLLALTPVTLHRALFRQRAKPQLVALANVIMRVTFVSLACTLTGTALLIFDVVLGRTAGIIAGSVTLGFAIIAWFLLPLVARSRHLAP
ncbi:DUF6328 family protein [uncultured Schumannella sp.]|uniref:DUF6328 family protein n=1 Tax=uncultured Schumannella sp. TaxID=1195956 RepID=UPI0025F776CE|nr:DUF6328 family protein [uncultured Schumannella sp.]